MDTKVKIELESREALTSVKDLQKALKSAKDEMVGMEAGSESFLKSAKKAGELKHQIDEINQSVRGASSDFGDMLGNVTKAGAGITGAFQAAKGAMNLFGVESENVTEAIAKMQNLMAMTQGLAQIDEGIKAFGKLKTVVGLNSKELGGFKKALIGTGLGALVVVLGSIVANWEEFSEAIGISSEQMEKFGDMAQGVFNSLLKAVGGVGKAISRLISGDFSGAKEAAKEAFDFKKNYAEGVEKAITKREEEETKKRLEIQKNAQQEWIKLQEEKRRLAIESYEEERIIRAAIENAINKQLEETPIKVPVVIEVEEGDEDYVQDLNNILNNSLSAQLKYIRLQYENGLITQEEYNQKSAELEQERIDRINQIGQIGFGAAADTLAAFAELQDTTTKEGFEQQKKLQIASTTMNMLGGVLSAWTSAMSPANAWMTLPGQIAMGAAQTVATVAMGAAQIAKIKKQTFDGGASSGAASANISRTATAAVQPVQYTQDIQGVNIESAIKDTRVYVTESDITNTQNKVNVAESESRF